MDLGGLAKDDILQYLWSTHAYLFEEKDLKIVVRRCIVKKTNKLLQTIFRSRSTAQIVKAMPFEYRLEFLLELISISQESYSTSHDSIAISPLDLTHDMVEGKPILCELLCEAPYALYGFLIFIERDPFLARRAYWEISSTDLEEFIRCAPGRVNRLVALLSD